MGKDKEAYYDITQKKATVAKHACAESNACCRQCRKGSFGKRKRRQRAEHTGRGEQSDKERAEADGDPRDRLGVVRARRGGGVAATEW